MRLPFLQSELHLTEAQNHNIKSVVEHAAGSIHEVTRTLVERSSSSSSDSSSSSCKPGDDSNKCVTPASVQSTQNLAIILGVVIPLTCAVAVLIFLHRRMRKKQKLEDINDPHKSLDFGMEGIAPVETRGSKKSTRKVPEMSVAEFDPRPPRRGHGGMSMDMGIGSPYLLPAGLHDSRESLHSMSRGLHDEHDPYRPVTMMRPSMDTESVRFGKLNDDKGSMYSASTGHHSALQDRAGLLAHARPMSQSYGKRADSMSPQDATASGDFSTRQLHSSVGRNGPTPPRKASLDKALPEINEKEMTPSPHTSLPSPPAVPEPVAKEMPPPPRTSSHIASPPPRGASMLSVTMPSRPESSNYGDEEPPAPSVPHPTISINEPDAAYDIDPAMIYAGYAEETAAPNPERVQSLAAPKAVAGNRLSVMGMRPLPPELPDDTPEVRANRIRSFYKEYFDDSKPNPVYGQYDQQYDDVLDGVIYDPDSGGFFAPGAKPWAQGPARRAMTPPPRARPRVSDNSSAGFHGRKMSMYSTMSGGRPRGRPMPKKKLPPPKALTSLPTPHKLKEDDLVYSPIDFAPPSTFREFQNGRRPDSPLGVARPYSPAVRPFTPLASSFDNLAVLPSPHDLRKSGTFTALDFAPPSKIRDPAGSPSDTGSIRSNRSGISAMQHMAVRDGAYRVSRIPKEMVTTRDDLALQLKPKMDMVSRA